MYWERLTVWWWPPHHKEKKNKQTMKTNLLSTLNLITHSNSWFIKMILFALSDKFIAAFLRRQNNTHLIPLFVYVLCDLYGKSNCLLRRKNSHHIHLTKCTQMCFFLPQILTESACVPPDTHKQTNKHTSEQIEPSSIFSPSKSTGSWNMPPHSICLLLLERTPAVSEWE